MSKPQSKQIAPNRSALYKALLAPEWLALVGISNDLSKAASRPLTYLRRNGFKGSVFPINKSRETVQGEKAWSSLSSLPERPDHVFIMLPADAALVAVAECGRLGIPVATVLASGFGEAGDPGVRREAELKEIVAKYDLRILGPSSLGIVNNRTGMALTANAAFAEPDLPAGGIFAASHSGSMMGALVSRGKARGIGFHSLVSVGNETNLSVGEICALTLDDPTVRTYALFLEAIRHGSDLRDFAIEAAKRGKPIAAYLLGRSSEARELAVSHTGALAGDADLADAFLAACGIARVDTLEALLEVIPLLERLPPRGLTMRRKAVGVVTTTGGGAAMIVDQLAVRGVPVKTPSIETLAQLSSRSVEAAPSRIVDLTLAGTRYEVMKAALEVLLNAGEFDLVVGVAGSSARFQPELAVKPIIDSAQEVLPIAAFIVPEAPEALSRLTAAGVPNFRTPESCADAIAAAWFRQLPTPVPSPRPTLNGASAQLSFPYILSLGLYERDVQLQHFGQETLANKRHDAVRRIMHVVATPEMDALYPNQRPARVTLTTGRGTFGKFLGEAPGAPEFPMSDSDISTKFLNLTSPTLGNSRSAEVLDKLWHLDAQREVSSLLRKISQA